MARLSLTTPIQRFRFFSYISQKNGRRGGLACSSYGSRHLSSLVEASDFELDEGPDDSKVAEKDTNLRSALSELSVSGVFDQDSKLWLQRFSRSRRVSVIPTGSLNLDLALGVGGLPKGRMVEVYGKEASGKTTLALHIIKEAQKLGGYCAYLDVENAMDPSLAESIGVNTEELLISRPDSAENMLSIVDVLTKSGSLDVIVVDSVAALIPQCELDLPLGDVYRDRQSVIMTQALRKIHYSVANSRTLIVFLNQVRSHSKSNMRFPHAEEVTCGGNALRFQAAIRLKMIRTGLIKTDDKISGLNVCVQVVKNKLTQGKKKSELGIHFGRGFYVEREVLELACEHGVIVREGSSHLIEGEVVDGIDAAEKYLLENKDVLDTIINTLRNQLF
uniref:DNA repair protein recA-like protein 2, mitochondrial n=2 Tax=Noccaea caerulescens TaxID=107243 RepID=A0A1J3ESZ8_NOCCA